MKDNSLIPPWKQPEKWREINTILTQTTGNKKEGLARASSIAHEVRRQLHAVTKPMDSLCVQTCRFCTDICCLKASIWADFRDLIFWHMSGQAIPLHQTISHVNQSCRYLGNHGCTLPRLSRPFVCTWYLCPSQVSRIRENPKYDDWQGLPGALQSIKQHRKMLENAFVEAVS